MNTILHRLPQIATMAAAAKFPNEIKGLAYPPAPLPHAAMRGDSHKRRRAKIWEKCAENNPRASFTYSARQGLDKPSRRCYSARMDSFTNLPGPALEPRESAVAKLSHRHDQIINWLLENPDKSLRACADHFHYSQGWLSQLIHSDIFQAQLKARQESVFVQIAQDIPTKLKGLADQAIEKVSEILERNENPDLVVDIFDKTLNRLGYAPQKGGSGPAPAPTQVNVFTVSKSDLAEARVMISAQQTPALEAKLDSDRTAGGEGGVFAVPASVSSQN